MKSHNWGFLLTKNKLKHDFLGGAENLPGPRTRTNLFYISHYVTLHDQTLAEKYVIVDYHLYLPKIACELVCFNQDSILDCLWVGVGEP